MTTLSGTPRDLDPPARRPLTWARLGRHRADEEHVASLKRLDVCPTAGRFLSGVYRSACPPTVCAQRRCFRWAERQSHYAQHFFEERKDSVVMSRSLWLLAPLVLVLVGSALPPNVQADFKDFANKVKEDFKKQQQQQKQQQQPQQQQHAGSSTPSQTGSDQQTRTNQAATASSAGAVAADTPRSNVKVTEEQLGDTSMGFALSGDGRFIATAMHQGSRVAIAINGKPGPIMDQVSLQEFVFSPDGDHFAYSGIKGGKSYLVVDHEVVTELPKSVNGTKFSVRTLQFAETGGAFVFEMPSLGVIAGGNLHQGASGGTISKDGRHFAFLVREPQNSESSVYLDGEEGRYCAESSNSPRRGSWST